MKTLITGTNLEDFSSVFHVTLSDIQGFISANYKFSLASGANTAYVIKSTKGKSILTLIQENDQTIMEHRDNGWNRLVETAAWWQRFYTTSSVPSKNRAFKTFYNTLNNADFTGILLFQLDTEIPNLELIGDKDLLQNAEYTASIIQIDGVVFSQTGFSLSEASYKALLSLKNQIEYKNENTEKQRLSFIVERNDIAVTAGSVHCSAVVCNVRLQELFGSQVSQGFLELYGVYEQVKKGTSNLSRYRFCLLQNNTLDIYQSFISNVLIDTVKLDYLKSDQKITLKLKCSGKLLFQKATGLFDPFSYGTAQTENPDGLPFSNSDIVLILNGGKLVDYTISHKNMALDHTHAKPRENSLAGAFEVESISFVSHENAKTPKKLGYTQMIAPVKQEKLGEDWHGIVIQMPMVERIKLKLLFAWTQSGLSTQFYAGSQIAGIGAPSELKVKVGGMFQIGFKSIALKSALMEENSTDVMYSILLKGLSIGMFGLSMPQSACDLSLISGKDGGKRCNAWYGVYDKKKERVQSDEYTNN